MTHPNPYLEHSDDDIRWRTVYNSARLTHIQIHNQSSTRALMSHLFDHQMVHVADFDCFSQVVFKDIEHYKRMKQDPWYKEHLIGDHEKFADTQRSMSVSAIPTKQSNIYANST